MGLLSERNQRNKLAYVRPHLTLPYLGHTYQTHSHTNSTRSTSASTIAGVEPVNTSSPRSAAHPRTVPSLTAPPRRLGPTRATFASSSRAFHSSFQPHCSSTSILTSHRRNALCSAVLSDGSQSLTLRYPGSSNLVQTDQGNFNDKLLSYQCFKEEEEVEEPSVPTSSPVTTVIPIPTEAPVVVQPPTEQPFMPTDVLTEELPSPTDVPTKKDPVDETPSSD